MEEADRLIARARLVALKSPCPKAKFGTLIINRHDRIIAEGYNGSPAWPGDKCAKHCLRVGVASGTQLELCYALHSEQWAILKALQEGFDLVNTWMVVAGYGSDGEEWVKETPSFYCTFCSRWIMATGIHGCLVDTVDGPQYLGRDRIWETSYQTARGGIEASGKPKEEG